MSRSSPEMSTVAGAAGTGAAAGASVAAASGTLCWLLIRAWSDRGIVRVLLCEHPVQGKAPAQWPRWPRFSGALRSSFGLRFFSPEFPLNGHAIVESLLRSHVV